MLRIWKQFRIEIVALILLALGVFFLVEDYDIRESLYAWGNSFWDDGRDLARRAYRVARTWYGNTTTSDLIGIAMVAAAALFVAWRLRWHILHGEYWTRRACPVCGGPLVRIHRTPWDRLISSILALPLYRYLCRNPECRWSGRRYGSHRLHQIHPSEFQQTVFRGRETADAGLHSDREPPSPNGAEDIKTGDIGTGEDAGIETGVPVSPSDGQKDV